MSNDESVILLHGLARTSASMKSLEKQLRSAGYRVCNVDYPSRKLPIAELAPLAIQKGLKNCQLSSDQTVHFVTHSMGGILLRYYLQNYALPNLGRVVMLGPPNKGSEAVDHLKHLPGFDLINGPAGYELGTGEDDLPLKLGPVDFELGVIAGKRSLNLILSQILPGPDDGKVSVEKTRVEGMKDFIILPTTHTFMMQNTEVIRQALHFLHHGQFIH